MRTYYHCLLNDDSFELPERNRKYETKNDGSWKPFQIQFLRRSAIPPRHPAIPRLHEKMAMQYNPFCNAAL